MCQRIQKDTEFAENITPLRFPTTALTDLYDQTKDIKLTQAAAGHTTSAMTLKYYVKGQETTPEAAAAVDQLYAGSLVGSWNKENPLPVAMQRIAGFLAAKSWNVSWKIPRFSVTRSFWPLQNSLKSS